MKSNGRLRPAIDGGGGAGAEFSETRAGRATVRVQRARLVLLLQLQDRDDSDMKSALVQRPVWTAPRARCWPSHGAPHAQRGEARFSTIAGCWCRVHGALRVLQKHTTVTVLLLESLRRLAA